MATQNICSVRRQLMGIALFGLALWLVMGVEVQGQEVSVEKGKGLYQRLCAVCHGKGGKGEAYSLFDPQPSALNAPATQKKTDEELLDTIRNGHPNTAMGRWKYALSEVEMRDVLTYIRTFGGKA
jgi:mono/diheme cytochrome c family protein